MASTAKRRSKGSKASDGKRKKKTSGSEEDAPAFLSSTYAEPPSSKIYNSRFNSSHPAEVQLSNGKPCKRVSELFRKDLISAMKLPDSEQLSPDEYFVIEDSWKPEWEKGVQVPVLSEPVPEPSVREIRKRNRLASFRLPRKFIRFTRDSFFNPEHHVMSYTNTLAERTCRYDMDMVDYSWLTLVNQSREDFGLQPLEELFVEQVFEEFEFQAYVNFQEAIKSEEGLGVEYDEDAICDVCRSATVKRRWIRKSTRKLRQREIVREPDSHDGNEMVFCDLCNICVHQICYGITKIPEGSWVCRTCALGITPPCELCPNRGGAMKTTRCGQKWVHVGCAVWIPEVSFLNFVKMEPVVKISQIPTSRWTLVCTLCKEKKGACITCSEKGCKAAFHVTCAFNEGLQMRATVKSMDSDDDTLKAFCQKHSKKRYSVFSDSEEETVASPNAKEALTSEERANLRQQKIKEKEAEFYNYVNIQEVSEIFRGEIYDIETIFNYWKLKRKANMNRAFLTPKIDTENTRIEENSSFTVLNKMVHHRQDLERARNLCYMVGKREKQAKRWLEVKLAIFEKQLELMEKDGSKMTPLERHAVLNANDGDIAYDKKYSGANGPSPNMVSVLTNLVGEDAVKPQMNGLIKTPSPKKSDRGKSEKTPNPYAKHYLNGLAKRSERWFPVSTPPKKLKLQSSLLSQEEKGNKNMSFQCVSYNPSNSDDGMEVRKSKTVAVSDRNPYISPKSSTEDFGVSGDAHSSGTELGDMNVQLLFVDDTKDIDAHLQTESSNDTESSCMGSLLLSEQENLNLENLNVSDIESKSTNESGCIKGEIVNPGEMELAANVKIDSSDCENVHYNNMCKLDPERQILLISADLSSTKKVKPLKLRSKHKSITGKKRKHADRKVVEVSSGSPVSLNSGKDEVPVKKCKIEVSDRKVTNNVKNCIPTKSLSSGDEGGESDSNMKSDSTCVPIENNDAVVKDELKAGNNKINASDPKSANHVSSTRNDTSNSKTCISKQKPAVSSDCSVQDTNSSKHLDVKSILGKSCLKVSLERNLEWQMEQNNVKLPQPYVVLKSEDIVNCGKNKSGILHNKSCFIRKFDDKSLKRAASSNADKSSDSNSHCDKSELKFRPVSSKRSPVRTQSPTLMKVAENGTSRSNKPSPKHNSQDKGSVPIKSSVSKQKHSNSSTSATASSSVNKRPSSPLTKCQEKNVSLVRVDMNSSDSKDASISKDKSNEAPPPRKDMLRGYKIPKKTKSGKPEANSLDLKRGSSPLSPLPDITPTGRSSYHSNAKSSWRKLEPRAEKPTSSLQRTMANGDSHQHSERLVLPTRNEIPDQEMPRWQADPSTFNPSGESQAWGPLLPPPLPPFQWVPVSKQTFSTVNMNYRPGLYKT